MGNLHRSWELSTWWRDEGDAPMRLSRKTLADLTTEVEDVPDEQHVQITAGMLRALLAPHHRPEATAGAKILDPERRVTYLATIGRGEGRVWLRTVEVVPHDSDPDQRVWRVPAQQVADAAAHLLDVQASDGADLIIGQTSPSAQPSVEELADMVRRGVKRRTIAQQYGRSESRVDDWLRLARRERPDLFPPSRRGPRPHSKQTTDGNRRRPKKEQENES